VHSLMSALGQKQTFLVWRMSHSKKPPTAPQAGAVNPTLTAIQQAPASALEKIVRSSDPAATLVMGCHIGGVPFVKS
jgi:hypothetical protein